MDTASLLRQVTIFRELPAEVLADLATRVRPRSAEAGSVIVSAEEPGDSLFVIARGKVKVVLY
ncbi:MAG TPA: cyclic nucleotide-binding domain-containing protein, partial [Myxococcales bacterium]|nr:cyclic nucleotide-binding domain-containing protein [Myxococcales bacterium]